jgi:predicted alpha/beta hydrolase family esterase
MKKVFIIHGLGAGPNSSWFPWLMMELKKHDIYACALAMPNPETPTCTEWTNEIYRHVTTNKDDDSYLVGHSLGVAAILNFLQSDQLTIAGAVLVSGRYEGATKESVMSFYKPLDYDLIKSYARKFFVIHGDNDEWVPVENAQKLSEKLGCKMQIIKNGGHLVGSQGYRTLPECLEALLNMMK